MKPKPMSPVVLAGMRDFALDTSESGAGTAARILSAHDYWRARVWPQAADVKRMGVTLAHCEAWMLANGWTRPMPEEYPHALEGPNSAAHPNLGFAMQNLVPGEACARAVSFGVAKHHGLGHWELLDQLALIELPTTEKEDDQ